MFWKLYFSGVLGTTKTTITAATTTKALCFRYSVHKDQLYFSDETFLFVQSLYSRALSLR